jgi:hypothetical protein
VAPPIAIRLTVHGALGAGWKILVTIARVRLGG